ncbi:MAG: restriction endonuclease subunit S [Spirochaetia bacterium]|nr:restriction endonuclease subunit S [Spirochaetia bacterium]
MEEWKEYKLGDLITDIAAGPFGSNLKVECFVEKGFPIIDGANLKGFKVTDNITKFVTKEKAYSLHRSIAHRNDIVVTISGTLGQISYIPENSQYEEYLCSQRQFRATFDLSKIDIKYLVYYFHSYDGQHKILSFANQVGVPALSQPLKNFRNIDICLPPLPTQQKIAAILSSLDDKIELNNKINTNLEQQAQALFKNWFVDFDPFGGKMPEGWKEKPLYDYADFINGTSFKEDEYGSEGLPIIKIAELKNGITEATQYFNGEKDSKYNVENEDILFSWSGNPDTSIDIFIWSLGNGILNQHTFNVKSYTNNKWFTYCLLKYFKPEFCHRASCKQTTGLGHVTASDLKQITFSSSEKSESDFENLITPIMKQISNDKLENQKLVNIRDTLLPKLMNGEIEV